VYYGIKLFWTNFQFNAPIELGSDLYLLAKHIPNEFRAHVVRPPFHKTLRRAAFQCLAYFGILGACFAIGVPLDFFGGKSVESVVLAIGLAGICVGMSGLLSFGSFAVYSLNYLSYWRRVIRAAARASSYEEFASTFPLLDNRGSFWFMFVVVMFILLAAGFVYLTIALKW